MSGPPDQAPDTPFINAMRSHPPMPQGDPTEAAFANALNVHAQRGAKTGTVPRPHQGEIPLDMSDWRNQLYGTDWGSFFHGMSQPVYGMGQDVYKAGEALTGLGGYAPNDVSKWFGSEADAVTRQKQEEDSLYRRAQAQSGNTGIGSMANELAGNVLSPASGLAGLVPGQNTLAKLLMQGGIIGAAQPTDSTGGDFWSQKAGQAELGAGTGIATHGLVSGASYVAQPTIRKSVQILRDAGVPLTVGQTLGGAAQRIEDSATSIPVVGDIIKNRRVDSYNALSAAMGNRALAPLGEKLPPNTYGFKAVEYTQGKFDDAYNRLVPHLKAYADPDLAIGLADIVNNPGSYQISPDQVTMLKNFIGNKVIGRANNGHFDGPSLKAVQSDISDAIRGATRGNAAPGDYRYADALRDLQGTFNEFLARHNPDDADELRAIDSGYAHLVRMEKAAGAPGAVNGVFSPAQLGAAVRSSGTRKTLARGAAPDQDLANAAREVLPSTVPDSGTPIRHAVELGAGVAGAMLGGEKVAPELTTTIGPAAIGAGAVGTGLAIGGTRPVQKALVTVLTKRPYSAATARKMGNALRAASPALVRSVPPLLIAPGNNPPPK